MPCLDEDAAIQLHMRRQIYEKSPQLSILCNSGAFTTPYVCDSDCFVGNAGMSFWNRISDGGLRLSKSPSEESSFEMLQLH